MYLLGLDIGTSSIKASLVDIATKKEISTVQFPDVEVEISTPQSGWAEQDPETWWLHSKAAIKRLLETSGKDGSLIKAIGISYQMHGLVMVDKNHSVLRPSIIWCDSRAVKVGENAFNEIGKKLALESLLNSPGNFTASKLAWVKQNEPKVYEQCYKVMLPGDFIGLRLTGEVSISNSGLSEGIFWDFKNNTLSAEIMKVYGFDNSLIPEVKPVFSNHGEVKSEIATELGLKAGTPVSYKAGDQPNNAFSLNVVNPGEIAATAGTSGVIYAVSSEVAYDAESRVNSFAHVNHQMNDQNRVGVLLCINGTGILNRWVKDNVSGGMSYQEMNDAAEKVPVGSDGLSVMPFGNGAERMLGNKILGGSFIGLDFNKHAKHHIFRAAQEGIAYSLKWGFEIMKNVGVVPKVIRAGKANMFLSSIFSNALVNATQVPVELYDTNGAQGAALGAGVGAAIFDSIEEAMAGLSILKTIEPDVKLKAVYEDAFNLWNEKLNTLL